MSKQFLLYPGQELHFDAPVTITVLDGQATVEMEQPTDEARAAIREHLERCPMIDLRLNAAALPGRRWPTWDLE